MRIVILKLDSDAYFRLQSMAAAQRVSVDALCEAILQFIRCPDQRPADAVSFDFYGVVSMNRFPANR